jgi:16S rRNA (adenine1518-N6/adenine1519-N6)-dimethyltransferase
MSMIDGLPPLRDVIAGFDLAARKSLGQNFLLDLNLTRRIAREAGPLAGHVVIEVGPGPGGLTRGILAEGAAELIVIERDNRCRPALDQIADASGGRLRIIQGDALEVDEAALLGDRKAHVVSNLPYNVGTALLLKWLTARVWPSWFLDLTLMFQKEVAERIVAKPGDDAFGRLSVISQWRTAPRVLFDVHRSAFTPPPKVTSSVVRFDLLKAPRGDAQLEALERVTAAAFGQRRKMLRSSLKALSPQCEQMLETAGILPTARAEEISVEGFAALARAYVQLR